MAEATYAKGLEGIIAAESAISRIDGQAGRLTYRGFPIEELAEYSDFEEVTYLLLYEKLPNRSEMEAFRRTMRASRGISGPILEMVRTFPIGAHPM